MTNNLAKKADDDRAWERMLRASAEDDLRSLGFNILVRAPKAANELALSLELDNRNNVATAESGGVVIDRLELTPANLPCLTTLMMIDNRLRCVARGAVSWFAGSEKVAQASRLGPPPAPAADGEAARLQLRGKLAVLELRNFTKDLTHENAQYFTDVVRGAALRAQPQLEVITRENLLVLLQATGKKYEECEGECEVDTGRRIGADEIVSGEIQKLGKLYKLSLRLHDTREGRLLASTQASGKSVEELDAATQKAAEDLVAGH